MWKLDQNVKIDYSVVTKINLTIRNNIRIFKMSIVTYLFFLFHHISIDDPLWTSLGPLFTHYFLRHNKMIWGLGKQLQDNRNLTPGMWYKKSIYKSLNIYKIHKVGKMGNLHYKGKFSLVCKDSLQGSSSRIKCITRHHKWLERESRR